MIASDYNYEIFPPEDDVEAFVGFASHLRVGETASDPELFDLVTRQTARLSDYSKKGLTVVELGSLT